MACNTCRRDDIINAIFNKLKLNTKTEIKNRIKTASVAQQKLHHIEAQQQDIPFS